MHSILYKPDVIKLKAIISTTDEELLIVRKHAISKVFADAIKFDQLNYERNSIALLLRNDLYEFNEICPINISNYVDTALIYYNHRRRIAYGNDQPLTKTFARGGSSVVTGINKCVSSSELMLIDKHIDYFISAYNQMLKVLKEYKSSMEE